MLFNPFLVTLTLAAASTSVSASRLKASTELSKRAQLHAIEAKRASISGSNGSGRRSRKQKRVACSSYLMGLFCDYSTDPDNCGGPGKKCPTVWEHGSGSVCHEKVCGAAQCDAGYGWSWSQHACIDVTSDSANCGTVGNHCSDPLALSQACVAGNCVATSCKDGDALVDGHCTNEYSSDPLNCGSKGRECASAKFSHGSGAVCVLGDCLPATCNAGYALDLEKKACQDIQSSDSNCGSLGNVCSFPHGEGSCKAGICTLKSCDRGYFQEAGVCTALDLSSDVLNCGDVDEKCSFDNGAGLCQEGKCTFTSCAEGYKLQDNTCKKIDVKTDLENCGVIGNKCQNVYVNGGLGRCVKGACEADCNVGFTWDPKALFCRPTSRDLLNCGGLGQVCAPVGAASAICVAGQCFASVCKSGYELLPGTGACNKIDTATNVNHCGALNRPCVFFPAKATGICENSQCVVTACPEKYQLKKHICVAEPIRQRARVKKSKKVVPTLCPKGEMACPIANSASFEHAANHHFTHPVNEYSGIMSGSGGYECLDIKMSLESCGGCSSTGEGTDCTKIPHARGVGCDAGKCHVFSCKKGWQPSLTGSGCVPAPAKQSQRRADTRRALHRRKVGAPHLHRGDMLTEIK